MLYGFLLQTNCHLCGLNVIAVDFAEHEQVVVGNSFAVLGSIVLITVKTANLASNVNLPLPMIARARAL